MAKYSRAKIAAMLDACDTAANSDAAGDALESLVVYLVEKVPSLKLHDRNILDGRRAHELDLAFWQIQAKSPIGFLDPIVIVECKNTGRPVGSADVGWFALKLQEHGANVGVLVALSGITGANAGPTSAHHEVLAALLRARLKILVISRQEIEALRNTHQLAELLRRKYLALSLKLIVQ